MIYLDNAASTRPAPEVLEAMLETSRELFANTSSAHALGAAAARALELARSQVAEALGAATPAEVVFTSGGTEADALGLLGAAARARGRHLVVTAIEHPAILRSAEQLVAEGYELTVVPVGGAGVVRVEDVVGAVRPDTAVVAVMLVNNELGMIQPIAEIAQALGRLASSEPSGASAAGTPRRPPGPHLHVDAVQAFGFLPIRVGALGADSLAISGHKLHGPKGTGALWVRPGARIAPLWDGGRQERGLRSGTENLPGWAALGVAVRLCVREREAHGAERVRDLRDRLEREVLSTALSPDTDVRPTVVGAPRVPHIASLAFPGLPAEPLLHALEARDVFASAGSACASRTRGPNHVLSAIGVDDTTAVIRFSLSRETTGADVDGAVAALREAIAEIAPLARAGGKSGRASRQS